MSNKSRRMGALTLACIAVALCISLMAVGTYALFSETITVSGHLQSGKLDATLSRVKLVKNDLNDEGFLETTTDNNIVPDSMLDNVFGLSSTDKIAPECSYAATMRITNNGDVAFGYYIKLDVTEGASTQLLQQLVVEVKANGQTIAVGAAFTSAPIGVVAAGKYADFTVTVKFANNANNNNAENQKVAFDLTVYAEQALAK